MTRNPTIQIRNLAALFTLLVVILGSLGAFVPHMMEALAVSPDNIISYQGRILNANGVPVSDASLDMEFRLYDSLAAGTCVWSNDSSTCASSTARSVTLTDGLFSENLGDTSLGAPYAAINDSTFADNATLYLEVEIEGETLSPRKRVVATGYAMNADTLDGLDSTDFTETLDDAYNNYGAAASIINIDAAEGQTGGLEFSVDGADNFIIDLQSTGDFTLQEGGGTRFTFADDSSILFEPTVTSSAAFDVNAATTDGNTFDFDANSLTTGSMLNARSTAAFSGDFWQYSLSGASTGNIFNILSSSATATSTIFNIDLDNGDNDNNVFVLTTDETTSSGTVADTVKMSITASGEVFSDVGFTAGASTNYYDGSITDSDANADDLFDFTLAAAADSFRVLTGNFAVGSGTPDGTPNGEDFYVSGGTEIDGNVRLDGSLTGNGSATFNDDVDMDFVTGGAGSENLSITSAHAADVSLNVISVQLTDTAAADTALNYALLLSNLDDAGATGSPDALARFNNGDTNEAIVDGLEITSAAGGITNGLDVSDAEITNGISIGANFVLHDGIQVGELSTGVMTWEDAGGNDLMTLTDSGTTGTLNVTGDITCTDCLNFTDFSDSLALDASTTITLDAAEQFAIANTGTDDIILNASSSGDIRFSSSSATADIRMANANNDIFLLNGSGGITYTSGATIPDPAVFFDLDTVTTETGFNIQAGGLTTGDAALITSGAFSGDILELFTAQAATGDLLQLTANSATSTARAINIDLDNGDNDNDVFVLTTDETTTSGTAVDTVKMRITASGEVFSDVGFTAGGASTNYYDGSITSTGAMTIDSSGTIQLGTDDDFLPQLGAGDADLGSVGTPWDNVYAANIDCVDCLDFEDFADAMTIDSATSIDYNGANLTHTLNGGDAVFNLDNALSDFILQDAGSPFFAIQADRTVDYDSDATTQGGWDLNLNSLVSGIAFNLSSTSGVITSADLGVIDHTATYAAGATISGQLLELTRDITVTSGVVDNANADLFRITSDGTAAGGTYTDTAQLLDIQQNNASATGEVLRLSNTGSGEAIFISQQADTSATVDATAGGALHIDNSGNDNFGLSVFSTASSTSANSLVYFEANTATFDQSVLQIVNAGTEEGFYLDQNGNVGTNLTDTEGGALHISNTGNDDRALSIYTNNDSTQNQPLMELMADDTTFDQPLLTLENQGTGAALYVDASGDTGATVDSSVGGTLHVGNATENDDYLFTVYNSNGAGANQPSVFIHADGVGYDQDVVAIRNDGNGAGSDALYIDHHFTDNTGGGEAAINVDANSTGFMVELFNDGNSDGNDGIDIQACADLNPGATCDYIRFVDGDGGVLGAIEGDGAGGVTNASAGGDYAELFPGTYANFSQGDVLTLTPSGTVAVATRTSDPIGAFSVAPNTLGNWVEDWQAAGTYVPIALLGQVPVNVNNSGGTIAAGDYLTMSATDGVAMKLNGPGYTIGMALEPSSGASDQIQVFINPGWHADNTIAYDGTNNTFEDDFLFTQSGTASAASPGIASHGLTFRGSGWDGATATNVDMTILADVTDSDEYRLSVRNTSGTEVAQINEQGDLAIAGRLYPSDRGTLQTEKYIFYDSSSPARDYMRTNADGWGAGSYDFAEMFPSLDPVSPGEIVIFADDKETVQRSSGETYDRLIAGIVSTRPGFLAGEFIDGHVPVALAGRVPTYVSTENGEIKPGDPLTTSSKPGYAMKATEPGPIVGYAMEPFSGDTGSVIAFVNVSYYDGGPVSDAPAAVNAASGIANLSNLDMSGNLNLNGGRILSVSSISGINNAWHIDENGNIVTQGRFTSTVRSYMNENVDTYAVTSPETTIQLSGTIELKDGRATVRFEDIDPKFNDIISSTVPYRVFVTPQTATGPLFVTSRDTIGFTIEEVGSLSDASVDWLVIAYHKDFEPEIDTEVTDAEPVEIVEEPVVVDPPVEDVPPEEVASEETPIIEVIEETISEESEPEVITEPQAVEEPIVEDVPVEAVVPEPTPTE